MSVPRLTKAPPVEKTRVRVKPGRTVYVGGGTHPFHAGDEFDLPKAEAEELVRQAHVDVVLDDAAGTPPA